MLDKAHEMHALATDDEVVSSYPKRFGKFTLIKLLARGGMAEILMAKAQGPWGFEKPLVIKRILEHLADDEGFIEMFLSEARVAARLHHPNIVQIYDLGRIEGHLFIAMEHIDGCSLLQLYRQSRFRNVPIPLPFAVHIIKEAAAGLHHAHNAKDAQGRALNVVHRDISPSNVMISRDGVVKLVDFGVAKAANQLHRTEAGAIKGKYGYMSPEQCQGKPVDARSDIFSLGVLLYECTTGARLFASNNPVEVLHRILKMQVPDPRELVPDYPAALRDIIFRMIVVRPEGRFQTVGEVRTALEALLDATSGEVSPTDVAGLMQQLFAVGVAGDAEPAYGAEVPSAVFRVKSNVQRMAHESWDSVEADVRDAAAESSVKNVFVDDDLDLPDVQSVLSPPSVMRQQFASILTTAHRRRQDRLFAIGISILALVALGSVAAWIFLLM